nr:immunoglobulin heavy chain junction region [Macaca mulatta]MOV86606.1 immunoglobulin heavy chain junction region [Macaca mulatta]MOV86607.1 immunoglobulin heavy chain junction region [Macaca mulatta]MOV86634.1 immunoglobulin heavy chain junction region [Macaca mulatta]MOV86637.1 immunoglobulin heavy chain junction region [Macaca mulatta]
CAMGGCNGVCPEYFEFW